MTDSQTTPELLADAPVLAHVLRGEHVESAHRGSVVVTAPDGSIELVIGADGLTLPRSSNKPMQAIAMVRAGLDLPDDLLALVCASHSGEGFHLEGVERILGEADLGLHALQNTPDLPLDVEAQRRWLASGHGPSSLTQNCSGKHAGMLATCVAAGWDHETYLEVDHPLQRACEQVLAELAGEDVVLTTVDGCGAPAMGLTLGGLARALGRIAAATDGAERRVADAIRRHPEFLGGTHRDVTALIAGTPGVVAKDGAEAMYAVGLPDGRGVALKIADGGTRARPVVLAAALRRLGVESEAYGVLEDAPVLGHGRPVGSVVAVGI
ncbi:asparaginase [Actinomycetota bacterium]